MLEMHCVFLAPLKALFGVALGQLIAFHIRSGSIHNFKDYFKR